MSCTKFETDIALYAGGDLPAGRMARLEAHLAGCPDCRALAEDLRASQVLLSELRDDPIADAMVAQVRSRVLDEVRRAGFSRRGTLVPLLALAAALVLAVVLVWLRHQEKPAHVAAVARIEAPRAMPAQVAPIVPVRHRVVRHRRRVPAEPPGLPLLVQFVTDNPNIVIYWLVDQKPQGD